MERAPVRIEIAAATMALAVIAAGCGVARRASVQAVDPTLRAKGQMLESSGDRHDTRIGEYEVEALTVEPTQVDPDGPLTADEVGRPIVQHHLSMRLRTPAGQAWAVECLAQRRQSTSADYAAVAGINRDDVAVECDLSAGDAPHWRFVTEAALGHNFQGRLTGPTSALDVEILVYVQRFGWLQRHLPDPVAQVRRDQQAVAAMLLGRPEQAWVSSDLPAEMAAPSVATMLALRHLPLGLDE